MEIKTISWQDAIPVRHRVLWPNKSSDFCHVTGDKEALHFGVYMDKKLVSVASLYIDSTEARLRKFATVESYQGKGIGSALLKHMLLAAKEKGLRYFWCDARESAKAFYQRFGLEVEGDRFYKSGVPYYKMCCLL